MTCHPTPLLLVGMSAREVADRPLLDGAAASINAAEPGTTTGSATGPASDSAGFRASVAFLQLGEPTLHRELTRAADSGASTIVVAGVKLGTLGPANSWLRRIAAHWWRSRPECDRPRVEVATSLVGGDLDVATAVSRTRPLHGGEAGITSPAWEAVPSHRHQVMVCRGPRCTALGSDETAVALNRELARLDQGDDDVVVTITGCQIPCNHAPVVSVQPDDVWYGRVCEDSVVRIVAEHLMHGRPCADLRLPRTRT